MTPVPLLAPDPGTSLSAPTPWRQSAPKPDGGFLRCPTDWLTLPWGLYRAGELPFLGLRTWLALLELPQRRAYCLPETDVHYTLDELCQLVAVPRRAPVLAALHTLEDLGLVAWSASAIQYLPALPTLRQRELPGAEAVQAQLPAWRTWVPAPRRLVRWLAREATPGLWATATGVLLRCLWSKGRQCLSGGRVAATWIATGFGVAERTVHRALESLQACGWLTRLPSTDDPDAAAARQHGARTVINLAWIPPRTATPGMEEPPQEPAPAAPVPTPPPCPEDAGLQARPRDHKMAPILTSADHKMTPIPSAPVATTSVKARNSRHDPPPDFYPLQEQTPDPVSAARAPEHPPGVWHDIPDHCTPLCLDDSTPTLCDPVVPEAPVCPAAPTAPRQAAPALAPEAVFAALPLAEQDAQLHAATARLLAQGLRRDVLIRPVLLAEVYAQLTPPSPVAPPAVPRQEDREALGPALAGTLAVSAPLPPPDLRDVRPADLGDPARLETLRQQAMQRGWLTGSAPDRLHFVAAAVHARRVGSAPAALFVALVRDRRWELLTDGDEDAARALLRPRPAEPVSPQAPPPLSEDARFVRGAQQVLRQEGWRHDPFLAVVQRYPAWTRARWEAALAELAVQNQAQRWLGLGEVLTDVEEESEEDA